MEGGVTGISIPRNYFDLSQEHCFTMEAGLIYPIYQALLMPGDVIEVDSECVVRQMPTIVPSFSNFKMKTWDFVVAIRNLDKTIYRFLSGFKEYTSDVPWNKPLPKWIPSDFSKTRPGTLWDMLENPINCIPREQDAQIDYFRQAYGYIWDIYFRNETRQDSILEDGEPGSWKGEDLLRVNWDRDFLTTSLPNQILGEPLALPITGIGNAVFNFDYSGADTGLSMRSIGANNGPTPSAYLQIGTSNTSDTARQVLNSINTQFTNSNKINFENSASILLSQLTEMLAIETMQTINALAGIRDDEFLTAHWGTAPSNEALQYPEIFGRNSMNIITSEVLQTAQDANGEGVGDMYGHGLGVGQSGKARFHCKEFSIYLKLAYIKPNTLYGNQSAKREYTQNTMYDFPFPELNHIAMQPIYKKEILCISSKIPKSTDKGVTLTDGGEDGSVIYNDEIAGYQPNYTWYTQKLNRVSGLLSQEQYIETGTKWLTKDNLYQWTEARFFTHQENYRPAINNDFLQCKLDNRNYQIVDDSIERSQFIVWHFNKVDAWRSLSSKRLPSTLAVTKGLA